MFVTYPHFRLPYQFDVQSTNWHSVEVFLRHSWFMATIEDAADEGRRTFFISSPFDLVEIALKGAGGRLVGVSLVIAPVEFEDSHWKTVRIKRVGQVVALADEPPEVVLTDDNGNHYMGFPLALISTPDREVVELARFS